MSGLGLSDIDSPGSPFPRLRYTVAGSPTLDWKFRQAAYGHQPNVTTVRGLNITSSGKAEYLHVRNEEGVRVDMLCESDELRWLFDYFRDFAAHGSQAEFWMNRNLGSNFQFEDNLLDQNGLPLLFNGGGSLSYVDATLGRGVVMTSTQYLSALLAQQTASTPTGYDDPLSKDEGVICLDHKPAYAGNDGLLHYLIDTTGGNNRLSVYKTAGNDLKFEIVDNAGGLKSKAGAVSWTANQRVKIIAKWTTAGVLQLYAQVNNGGWTELTTSAGAGTGLLTVLPTTVYVGATNVGASNANGAYDQLTFFKRGFNRPLDCELLRLPWRNFWPRAELMPLMLEPQQMWPMVHVFRWPLMVRNGE